MTRMCVRCHVHPADPGCFSQICASCDDDDAPFPVEPSDLAPMAVADVFYALRLDEADTVPR